MQLVILIINVTWFISVVLEVVLSHLEQLNTFFLLALEATKLKAWKLLHYFYRVFAHMYTLLIRFDVPTIVHLININRVLFR